MHVLKKYTAYTIATVFGIGYAPKAPGTFGTLPGVFFYFLLPNHFLILGLFAAGWLATYFVLQDKEDPDPSFVVIDEVVGMMLTLSVMSYFGIVLSLSYVIAAFLAFRVFDILKPWPIRNVERYFERKTTVFASFGVMIDDVIAGGLAGYLLVLISKFF